MECLIECLEIEQFPTASTDTLTLVAAKEVLLKGVKQSCLKILIDRGEIYGESESRQLIGFTAFLTHVREYIVVEKYCLLKTSR